MLAGVLLRHCASLTLVSASCALVLAPDDQVEWIARVRALLDVLGRCFDPRCDEGDLDLAFAQVVEQYGVRTLDDVQRKANTRLIELIDGLGNLARQRTGCTPWCSSCEIATETLGWEMLRTRTAPEIEFSRQTARKVRSARGSSMGVSAVQADKWLSIQVENRMIDAIHIVHSMNAMGGTAQPTQLARHSIAHSCSARGRRRLRLRTNASSGRLREILMPSSASDG